MHNLLIAEVRNISSNRILVVRFSYANKKIALSREQYLLWPFLKREVIKGLVTTKNMKLGLECTIHSFHSF